MARQLVKGALMALAVALGLAATEACAEQYQGTLGTADIAVKDGLITGHGDYSSNVSFSWVVNDTDHPGFWTYTYTFDGPNGQVRGTPALSHIIVEVSANFIDVEESTPPVDEGPGTFTPGPGNPNMPGNLFGLKFQNSDEEPFVLIIVTDRRPVWGDVYFKGGSGSSGGSAYNAGFSVADPLDPPANGSILDHALVPDTVEQPQS